MFLKADRSNYDEYIRWYYADMPAMADWLIERNKREMEKTPKQKAQLAIAAALEMIRRHGEIAGFEILEIRAKDGSTITTQDPRQWIYSLGTRGEGVKS